MKKNNGRYSENKKQNTEKNNATKKVTRKRKSYVTDGEQPSTSFQASDTNDVAFKSGILIVPDVDELRGKEGYCWKTKATKVGNGKFNSKNTVKIRPGPKVNVNPHTEKCFNLFLLGNIINEILIQTNEQIERQQQQYRIQSAIVKNMCKEELTALSGLLILPSTLEDNHLSAKLLFNSEYFGDRYHVTLSRERFQFFINCLKFNHYETREERQAESSCID